MMQLIKSADVERLQYAAANFKKNHQYGKAEEAYAKLVVLERATFGCETSAVALNLYNLAEVLVHQRKYEEARKFLRQAVEIWEKAHPNDYLSLLSYTEAVAMVKRQAQRTTNVVKMPDRRGGKITAA
jgi:tetratricopeptide (TPR) repeat protein